MGQDDLNKELEELLSIAEASTEKVVFSDTNVDKFIRDNNIQSGDTFIPAFLIWYMYYRWSTKKRAHKNSFFKQFKRNFKAKMFRRERGYLLDESSFDMSQEYFFRARIFTRNQHVKRQKEKNKTKPS